MKKKIQKAGTTSYINITFIFQNTVDEPFKKNFLMQLELEIEMAKSKEILYSFEKFNR